MMKRSYRIFAALLCCVMLFGAFSIDSSATELKTGIGIVTASSLRLRAKPNTDSEILATAKNGDYVVIIREVDDWYLVNYNLYIGYMSAEYIEVKEKENVKLGYASFDCATNVRSGPGTDNSLVKQAPAGETCFIIGFNCGWYKVSFNGDIGYVRSDLLTLLEKPYENSGTAAGEPYKPSSSGSGSTTAASYTAGSNGTLGQQVVDLAMQYLGYKYVSGGAKPSTGFDCSGLCYYVYNQFGYNIGRTSSQQLKTGTYVSWADLQPGDVVLFERTYTSSEPATHSGIYIGNGQFIHAANSRKGVIITYLSEEYYASRFICGRRYGA